MAPTIQTASRSDKPRHERPEKGGRSDIVGRVKYNNTLPDIPFDPKFIIYPFEPHRFVQYNPTSLERSYKHELLTEHDLGIMIDLINPDTYSVLGGSFLENEDEKLLEEEVATPADSKRSRHHSKNVSWLRKTEYISTEYNRFIQSADKVEAKVGFSIKKHLRDADPYKDKASQIMAIENTFEQAKKPLTNHYSKPGVTAVNVSPVFPDFEMWKHPCAQVIFDSDPAPKGRPLPAQIEEMSQAMIRGMVDESGDQFVAYFLPTEETQNKRKRDIDHEMDYDPEDIYDYILAREYNWNVKNKAFQGYEETYFFVFKPDGVYYNELETRVRLSKRRKVGSSAPGANTTANSRLLVKHRELNQGELNALDARMMMLEPPVEEDEYEDEEEDMNIDESGEANQENAAASDEELNDKDSDEDDRVSLKSAKSTKSMKSVKSTRSTRSQRRSQSRSKSRSLSRTPSRSRSRSRSRSGSKSPSKSPSRSRSRSRSKSKSRTPTKSQSRSRSRSGSESGSGSGSDDKGKKDEEEIFGSGSSDED